MWSLEGTYPAVLIILETTIVVQGGVVYKV